MYMVEKKERDKLEMDIPIMKLPLICPRETAFVLPVNWSGCPAVNWL